MTNEARRLRGRTAARSGRRCPSWTGWNWWRCRAGPGAPSTARWRGWSPAGSAPRRPTPPTPCRRRDGSTSPAAGLGRLAEQEGLTPDELVRRYPVSAQWRRSLMERLDALAAIYRLACAVSSVAFPIRFRWYRSLPLDAGLTLPGGRTVGILRQGLTADRTGFAKRLWRLREGPMPGTVLVLMADQVRLRHARRLLSAIPGTGPAGRGRARRRWPGRATASGVPPPSTPPWTCATSWNGPTPAGSFRWRTSRSGPRCPGTSPSTAPAGTYPTTCCPCCSRPPRSAPWTWYPTGPGSL